MTTPTSVIDVSGTANYERNVYNYAFDAVENDFVITDPGNGNVILNNDALTNSKGVADYITYVFANTLQSGIADGDTIITTEDEDTTAIESRINIKVDNTLISSIYSNRLDFADLRIQKNTLMTTVSDDDLNLHYQMQ